VAKGELIYTWDPYNAVIISEFTGKVVYHDLRENVTYRDIADEQTDIFRRLSSTRAIGRLRRAW